MTDTAPPWLITMRVLSGTEEAPGTADNPTIMGWADDIARRFPEMASYSQEYRHDSIPWCGLAVAYCMAANGIRPPFGSSDTESFLWANAWARWGTHESTPRLGCVMVFTRNGGGHVALYESEDESSYIVRGGNQSDAVNVTHMPKSQFTAAVWPPEPFQQSGQVPLQGVETNAAKGSWYSQYEGKYSWVDRGDAPGSNALGVPDDEQGIALPTRAALGQWFDVTAPNGVTLRLQQTDVGPGAKTGRGIDISAVAAERFGYTPRNFPTDEIFSWRPATESAPVPNTPVILPPTKPGIDPAVIEAILKAGAQMAASKEGQAFLTATLPKLLGSLGLSVPGLGVIGVVAGIVLPMLLPDLMGQHVGTATAISSAGIGGIGLLNWVKGAIDKIGKPA